MSQQPNQNYNIQISENQRNFLLQLIQDNVVFTPENQEYEELAKKLFFLPIDQPIR